MTPPEKHHPLLTNFQEAEGAFAAEVRAAARAARRWLGDYRNSAEAKALPSYPRFVAAREAWYAAGRPIIVGGRS